MRLGETRLGKKRLGKARQGSARLDKARLGKASQDGHKTNHLHKLLLHWADPLRLAAGKVQHWPAHSGIKKQTNEMNYQLLVKQTNKRTNKQTMRGNKNNQQVETYSQPASLRSNGALYNG